MTRLPEEYEKRTSKVILDSCSLIGDRIYYLEVQSYKDGTMALRMLEYDFLLGIAEARRTAGTYYVQLPKSCVIYLRHDRKLPDHESAYLILQDGQIVKYRIPTVKVQEYSADEIFEKGLYGYLPFYLLRYEKDFSAMEESDEGSRGLQAEYERILDRLAMEMSSDPGTYQDLLIMMRCVMDHVLRRQKKLKERMEKIVGGRVLPLPSDKIREAKRQGINQGINQGIDQGIGLGRVASILELLRELGDLPEDLKKRIQAEREEKELSRMLKLAAKAESIAEFQEALKN